MVSKKKNRAYGLGSPLQDVFPEPVKAQRAPTTSDLGYEIGQMWVDQVSGQIYGLASVASNSAVWSVLGLGALDFIGQATLVLGTVTVANTNIAATDKIFLSREGVGASTTLGELDVSISAATSFTITALQTGTPGSTETGDLSVVNYFIVRQL